jgi:hypothetical protein
MQPRFERYRPQVLLGMKVFRKADQASIVQQGRVVNPCAVVDGGTTGDRGV